MITKSRFKELCDTNHVYGRGQSRINAIYFEWQDNDEGRGFKAAVASSVENCTKAELFDILYDWITKEVNLPYYVFSKYAHTDAQRFKVPITFNPQNWN
jgi:hypothetical protein